MPTYDYFCNNCYWIGEVMHSFKLPNAKCPVCGEVMEKVIVKTPLLKMGSDGTRNGGNGRC